MRCEKCGSEWKVNNSMEKSITVCPFCQAQLKPRKQTINEVFRWIVDNKGIQVFQQKHVINAYLADLVNEEQKGRNRIKLALSSGAGELFYKLWNQSKGQLTEVELNRFLVSIEDIGFTKEFSSYILSVFLYSVSFSPHEQNIDNKKQPHDENYEERCRLLSQFSVLVELIRQRKEQEEKRKSNTSSKNISYSSDDVIPFPLFNSITNHPVHGNEKKFVHIRACGEKKWCRSMLLIPGEKYEVDILFKNDATPVFNTKQWNYKGVALNSRISVELPSEIMDKREAKIVVSIMCDNTMKACVDNITINSQYNREYKLHYIPDSAKIKSKWRANNCVLPISLFSKAGTIIGLNELNGVIPGGDDYSGHVRFLFEIHELFEVKAIESTKRITYTF